MHLEIQIDVHKLVPLLRQRFLQQRICVTDPITFDSETFYFDHLTISDATHFERVYANDITVYNSSQVHGYQLHLIQPITLFGTTLDSLQHAGAGPAQYLPYSVTLVFDVSMQKVQGGWALHLEFNTMATSAPDEIKTAIQNKLSSLPPLAPFDLSFLKQLTGQDFVVAESFVSCDPQVTRIAIRFEQSSAVPEGAAAWERFLTGNIENPTPSPIWVDPGEVGPEVDGPTGHPIFPHGHPKPHWETPSPPPNGDWSVFISFGLIEPKILNMIDGASSDTFQIYSQTIAVTWTGDGVQAEFHAESATEPFKIYVGVHVWITAQLSIDAQAQLAINGNWDYSVDPGDVAVALVASGGIGLGPGAFVGGVFGGVFGVIVGAIVGAVAGSLATLIDTASSGSPLSLPGCTTDDDAKQFSCTQTLQLPTNPLLGKLTVEGMVGLSGGPLLFGSLIPPADLKPVTITKVYVSDWVWGIQGSCSTSLGVGVSAEIVISATGAPPLHLCNWFVPQGTDIYSVLSGGITVTESPGISTSSVYVDVSPGGSSDAFQQYTQNPYSFQLVLQTSAGTRLITLPPIPLLTDAQKQELQLTLMEARVNCEVEAARSSQLLQFNPLWSVDPGPEVEIDARWWEVAASGLTDGESLAIKEASGRLLVQTAPTVAGFARVDALTDPGVDITVVRAPTDSGATPMGVITTSMVGTAGTSAPDKPARRVVVTETVLTRAARIELSVPCKAVEASMLDGVPVAFCITEHDTHELYDLSNPFRPALRGRVVVPGLRGVVPWGGYLVLWSTEGLGLVGGAQTYLPRELSLPQGGIARVTGDKQLIVEQEDGMVLAFDQGLRPAAVAAEPLPRTRDTWPISGWLAHASRVGRTLVRLDGAAVEIWWIGRSATQG